MRLSTRDQSFAVGLNTKSAQLALPFGQWAEFLNIRVNERVMSRRKGFANLYNSSCAGSAISLDAGTGESYIRIPSNPLIHNLHEKFTIDVVINPSGFDIGSAAQGNMPFICFEDGAQPFTFFLCAKATNAGTVYQIGFRLMTQINGVGDVLEYDLISTEAFDLTEQQVIPIRIVRDGTHMEMRIPTLTQNTIQCSIDCVRGTSTVPTYDLILGSLPDDTFQFTGIIDEFRIFTTALDGFAHSFVSFPYPRYPGLTALYQFNNQGTTTSPSPLIIDLSKYGNHGEAVGAYEFVSGLCLDLQPITALMNYKAADNSRLLVFNAGTDMMYSRISH